MDVVTAAVQGIQDEIELHCGSLSLLEYWKVLGELEEYVNACKDAARDDFKQQGMDVPEQ